MRLTLRTLLAYVDDILEPEDAQAIAKKIEESEFATTLLHRTRDVMRRLRLGSPEVTDRGPGLDPNTVGEYLDNTLPDDQVLDFEKVCLESDVHLAEVAACHQILALVLGEPAEVDPESRQRIYELTRLVDARLEGGGDAPAAGSATESQPDDVVPIPEPAAGPLHIKPGVPQWLRDETPKRRGWWRVAAAAGVILICVVLVMAVTGQFERNSFLAGFFGSGQADPSMAPTPGPTEPVSREPSETPSPAPESDQAPDATEEQPAAAVPEPVGEAQATDMSEPAEPPADPGQESPAEPSVEPESNPPLRQPFSTVEPDRGAMPEPSSSPAAQPPVTDMAVNTPNGTLPPAGEREIPAGGPPESRPEGVEAPVPMDPLGQLDSPMQVVLRFDGEKNSWQRLPDQAPLKPQTKYLSLPTYRPMFRLLDEARVWLIDGAKMELLPSDGNGVPGVALEFGRVVVEGPPEAGSRLRLAIADQAGTITFQDAGARLAIELSRTPASNSDPETQPAPTAAHLYAASGRIVWQGHGDDEPTAMDAPVRLALDDESPQAVAVEKFPNWIVTDTMSLLDQRASSTVQRELEVSRSAELGLFELADHRRKEVRWLALRCLDALGDFELMVTALDNPEENMAWPDYVEHLRAAVARSPEAAAQVRTAMEKLHGIEGASLYEMLWRYNLNALDSQEAARLTGYLEHDTLAFRVVAFQTLKRITRLTINYRPEDTAQKRQPWVEKWRERLEASAGLGPDEPDDLEEPPDGGPPSTGENFPL